MVRLRDEILKGSRSALASGITLVESRHPTKRAQGNYLLSEILAAERKRFEKKGTDALIFRIGRPFLPILPYLELVVCVLLALLVIYLNSKVYRHHT